MKNIKTWHTGQTERQGKTGQTHKADNQKQEENKNRTNTETGQTHKYEQQTNRSKRKLTKTDTQTGQTHKQNKYTDSTNKQKDQQPFKYLYRLLVSQACLLVKESHVTESSVRALGTCYQSDRAKLSKYVAWKIIFIPIYQEILKNTQIVNCAMCAMCLNKFTFWEYCPDYTTILDCRHQKYKYKYNLHTPSFISYQAPLISVWKI